MAPQEDYYTLADLMGYWEQGELTLDEVLARWPHDDEPLPDELVRELLHMLLAQARRIATLERRILTMSARVG